MLWTGVETLQIVAMLKGDTKLDGQLAQLED